MSKLDSSPQSVNTPKINSRKRSASQIVNLLQSKSTSNQDHSLIMTTKHTSHSKKTIKTLDLDNEDLIFVENTG